MYRLSSKTMLTLLGLTCIGLSACSSPSFPPRIYRMDVQQGNHITKDMVSRLKVGMSKEQVRQILGTPALSHSLNANRWDYYYYKKPGNGKGIVKKHFAVFFKGGKVSHFEGNY